MKHPAQRPLGAQISHMLKDRGVSTIFGIPGVHNIEMYRGIEEAGITHVLARHEQGAGFMADGYARASGRPGVAYVITGPGVCNIMTPMGQAYSDSVPMLVISSCLNETAATRGQLHQMLDQRGAAATVCDWSEEARTAEAAYTLIDRALVEFETERPRPKHLQLPIALLGAPALPAPLPPGRGETHGAQKAGDMRAIADDILQARKPVFIVGGGLAAAGGAAREHMSELLRCSGAAAFETYAGRGVLAADDPLNFGSVLGRPESAAILAQSDLVIAIGTELSECDLWRRELGHQSTLIRVDICAEVLADHHRAEITIHADAFDFVMRLLRSLVEPVAPKWDISEIASAKARFRAETDAERPGIVPICDALSDALPENTMVYSDMTQFAYVAKEVWDMPHPGHWHHPTGFGTLGYALPAAIGGAVARRENAAELSTSLPTIAIAGDYGFQYTIQELGTAVELGLPLPILIWDNAKLGEIEDAMVRSQIAPNAVVAHNPDFLKLAEAYGALSCEPASLPALQQAVLAALDADRPTLIRMTSALTKSCEN